MNYYSRRYLRLDEISEKTVLTQGDVLDAIEQERLCFCAKVNWVNLGAITMLSDQITLVSVFDYDGMVRLREKDSKALALSLQPHYCQWGIIQEPEKICHWRSVREVFPHIVRAKIHYSTQPFLLPNRPFMAYFCVDSQQTVYSALGEIFHQVSGAFDSEFVESCKQKLPREPQHQLMKHMVEIQPEWLRLEITDLVNVFGSDVFLTDTLTHTLDADEPQSTNIEQSNMLVGKGISRTKVSKVLGGVNAFSQSALDTVNTISCSHSKSEWIEREVHCIKPIIALVLTHSPNANSRQIWNTLKSDVRRERKVFDTEAMIFDIDNDELHYFGLGDTTKRMSYRRFQNLVSEVRGYMH